jgi:hypothetical protein
MSNNSNFYVKVYEAKSKEEVLNIINNLSKDKNKSDSKKRFELVKTKTFFEKNIIISSFKIIDSCLIDKKIFDLCFNELFCLIYNLQNVISIFNKNYFNCSKNINKHYKNIKFFKKIYSINNEKHAKYYYIYKCTVNIFLDLLNNDDLCYMFQETITYCSKNIESHSKYMYDIYFNINNTKNKIIKNKN